ncbi:Fanconi anemia group F protein [Austrofundulus limnaeus]|uniref:Fanconi anemia group F protein n=1 Tax=Austrofundulus limnaeus TaxID=52670 RepID=A0A2I4BMT0_AUSLI|nr:PREDICTED: Fanconi anemia group F protein [Austrofundulus limnaeus]
MRSNATGTPAGRKLKIQLVLFSEAQWLDSECGERHIMEAVLKNLSVTVELLAVAAHSSGVLDRWDEQTLSRAFHWAKYCEHIHSRFHNNPAIRRVLEEQLLLTNQSLRKVFPGCSEVYFSDLSHCQHLLLVGLLNNPELPISIMKVLFKAQRPGNILSSDYEDAPGLCSHIIQCKSICKVLRPLGGLSAVGADAEVQGEMLMERLGTDLHGAEDVLCSVLQVFEGAAHRLCLVIAAALLTRKDSTEQSASQDFLSDWLQRQHAVLQRMCSVLPPALLKELVKRHQIFRAAFCKTLKQWASEMEYRISDGEWVHSTTPTVSFQKLTELFRVLFEACPAVKSKTEDELNALKISDGDFDVRGLSVWGDLLSALSDSQS